MAHRIEVAFKPGTKDALGESICERIRNDLHINVESVRSVQIYTLEGDLTSEDVEYLASVLFSDPINQTYTASGTLLSKLQWDWSIEVGYKPGVMDSVGLTAADEVRDLIDKEVEAFSSRSYLLSGSLSEDQVQHIARELLANDLIERYAIYQRQSWNGSVEVNTPRVHIEHQPAVEVVDLDVSDDELLRISKARLLALNLDEMKAIRQHLLEHESEREARGLSANPTDAEIETLAQNWSEHCKHKIFRGLVHYQDLETDQCEEVDSIFKTYIQDSTKELSKEIDWLMSVFVDNAGVIKLDEEYNLVFKVETHNSPSALDPYGGALTGIVGVNRDPMGTGLGCRLLFNTDVFCFADPNYSKPLPSGLKHPKRIFEGVRRGVEDGGNKSGIPTINGTIRFDNRYLGKPLVYCGTGGIMPARVDSRPGHEKEILPGDYIVVAGGRIGADGIHGATFSSEALTKESPTTAVQLGNPFVQKVMADMLTEAQQLGFYRAIHDNGAGGLSCSISELAGRCGGAEVHLERALLKYSGLDPWEILLSESQERMTMAISPENWEAFRDLAERRDVEICNLGTFTDSGYFDVYYNNKPVVHLDVDFVLDGHPQKVMKALWKRPKHEEPQFQQLQDLGQVLHKLLGRLNVCSKEYVIRQYDHEVQGTSIIKPLTGAQNDGPSDAAVIWPVEMMGKGSKRGFVVSNGINPNYGDIDAYHMTALVIDEAIRNAVAVGADPSKIALLDNYSWSSPDEPFSMAQLVRSCKALYDCALAYKAPFISGKDSMYNDFRGELNGEQVKISVPPTLLISALGIIPDISKAVTMDLKEIGNAIYLLGETRDELGGSEYFAILGEEERGNAYVGNSVPQVNTAQAPLLYAKLHHAINNGFVKSAHDLSEGGLAVAAAEMSFAGGLGMELDISTIKTAGEIDRLDKLLYSESPSRLLIEVSPENESHVEALFVELPIAKIGSVTHEKLLKIKDADGSDVINEEIDALKASWQRTLDW